MSFTYDFATAPQISYVRALIPDTDAAHPIFTDAEINAFLYLESSQGLYTSGQAWPNGTPASMPIQVYSYRRAAAMAIDAIASSSARLSVVEQILDVKLSTNSVQRLHDLAESLREQEENMGNFAIAELVYDPFAARERTWNQLMRIEGGG